MFVANESSTVVVDIGTETYKIGYSDNGTPTRFGSSANIKNNYTSPVQNSTIVDLPSYLNILKNNIPEDTSYLFVAENTFEPLEKRGQILKFVMEENLCNSVFFMKSGLLDAFSYGRHNALVLSINGGSIQICTVLDGIITNRKMVNVGCLSLTKKFVRTPEESTTFMDLEYGRMAKEEFYADFKIFKTSRSREGDSSLEGIFKTSHSELLKALEMVKDVVNLLTEDKKDLLLSNVVIAGSGSCIPFIGFEVEKILNNLFKNYKTRIYLRESRFHTFSGGVVYSNIGTSKLFHISKLDYQEFGLSVLDRKNYAWTL
nr:unnamed protein product [Papilio xuthus]